MVTTLSVLIVRQIRGWHTNKNADLECAQQRLRANKYITIPNYLTMCTIIKFPQVMLEKSPHMPRHRNEECEFFYKRNCYYSNLLTNQP